MKNTQTIFSMSFESFKQNLFKSLFAFFVASFITGFANIFCSFVIIFTSKTLILPFLSLFILLSVNIALNFGLQLLVYLLYKKENAIIGHLFYFFKDFKRIAVITIFQIIVYFVLIYVSFIPFSILGDVNSDILFFQTILDSSLVTENITSIPHVQEILENGLSFGFLFCTIISVILILFFHLITSFIPLKLFENPNLSVFKVIKDSVKLCAKSIFEIIVVCFMTCRWILLAFVGAIILIFVFNVSFFSSLLSFILGLLLISAFFGISAFYCYKFGNYKTENSNIILLPEYFEAEILEEDSTNEDFKTENLENEISQTKNTESEGEK